MEWEFCRYDVLSDLSGLNHDYKMEQDIFIDMTDVSGNFNNPFRILYKINEIVSNVNIGLSMLKEYSENFQKILDLNCQDEDDILFYSGMIEDSLKYHQKSYNIKLKKLYHDLNSILKNNLFKSKGNALKFDSIDKKNCSLFEESFNKVKEKTEQESKNLQKPIWIKDNHIEQLQNLTNELVRVFKYHFEINLFFLESILRELQFYSI